MATKTLIQSQLQVQKQEILFDTLLYEVPILLIEQTLVEIFENPGIFEARLLGKRTEEPYKDSTGNFFLRLLIPIAKYSPTTEAVVAIIPPQWNYRGQSETFRRG